ncbi:MAG: hypothetical protein ISS47_01440 [Candidatus Omnitrophica bacterium]|nr:hypothetical protein [Candidatus Omnitrophota bacterium]
MFTIIATDNPQRAFRRIKKVIRVEKITDSFLRNMTMKVKQLVKESNNPIVFAPDSIANKISLSNNVEIRCYTWEQLPIVNRINYKPLHEFSDALVRISSQAGPDSGLLYGGLSIFQILEILWIEPLLNNFSFYLQMFSEVLQKRDVSQVKIVSMRQEMKHLIMSLAKAKGIPSKREYFSLGGKIMSLLEHPLLPSLEDNFNFSLKLFLSEMKKTIRTTAYDKIKKPRVLFIGYKERTLRRLQAALPVLLSRVEFEPCLLAGSRSYNSKTTAVIEELQQSGLRCSWIPDWISLSEAKKLLRESKRHLIKGWDYIESRSKSDLAHDFLGVQIFPYAKRMLKSICINGGCYASLLAEIASRLVARCRPSLVVNFEDWGINRAVTLKCRQYGIPNLAYYNLSPNLYTGLVRRLPEWIAVSGKVLYDEHLINAKRDPERLIIVGDTLSDKIKSFSHEEARIKVCQAFGLSKEKKIVVVLSARAQAFWPQANLENYYRKIFQAIRNLKDIQAIIKVHPQHSIRHTEIDLMKLKCRADAITQDYDLTELSLAADLVCFAFSTGGTYPMMVGTSAVTIQPRNMVKAFDELSGFVSGGGAVLVMDDEDATSVFRKLLYDSTARQEQIERARKFVTRHCGSLDGFSSQRLANLIVRIIKQKEKG